VTTASVEASPRLGNASDSYGESIRGHWNFAVTKHSHILLARSPRPDFTVILISRPLGGAGFASQRTTEHDREWNLDDYDGIQLLITEADAKRYTFILKDQLLPPDPETGREQSTISYGYDFQITMEKTKGNSASVFVA
jgi:hypothetical protein